MECLRHLRQRREDNAQGDWQRQERSRDHRNFSLEILAEFSNLSDTFESTMADVITSHIVSTPGICGGKPCIAGHCIQVADIAIYAEYHGWSPDEIVSQLQGISLADVHAALAYYFDHRDEIEAQIQEEVQTADKLRAATWKSRPARFRTTGVRAR